MPTAVLTAFQPPLRANSINLKLSALESQHLQFLSSDADAPFLALALYLVPPAIAN